MSNSSKIMLAFYGDDFTGSTDALEFISRAGARAILFTDIPTQEQLDAFPHIDVIGVAGKTRSLLPTEMEEILVPSFEQLKLTGARHVHYKVCSTFDSSPMIGSIGKAIDCGAMVFKNDQVPMIGGMPSLGRYCLFGNLFARMGIGSAGKMYRLDRHPSMSKHPVTPSDESDLRVHIAKQTKKQIGLIDILQLNKPKEEWCASVNGEEILLVDVLEEAQLARIGEWMDQLAEEKTLFSVGSSAVEKSLGDYWNQKGFLNADKEWPRTGRAEPLLVVTGSCSPVTAAQIEWVKLNGFETIALNAMAICNGETVSAETIEQIISLLNHKKNVIVHTGIKETENLSSEKLGTALGNVARQTTEACKLKRVIVCGGDTSSYAARAMEIEAVEMIAPLVPGAPLCKAYSKNKAINGLEVNFKGGQVGAENYFELMVEGKSVSR